jgi:hypothetical protein
MLQVKAQFLQPSEILGVERSGPATNNLQKLVGGLVLMNSHVVIDKVRCGIYKPVFAKDPYLRRPQQQFLAISPGEPEAVGVPKPFESRSKIASGP